MSEPYVGEIRCVGFDYAPDGWAMCNGQTVPLSQYQALFALIGTTYGGDGVNTIGLPNLSGRGALSQGTSAVGTKFEVGQTGGSETAILTSANLPLHAHNATISFSANPSLKAQIAVSEVEASQQSPIASAMAQVEVKPARGSPILVSTYAAAATAGATLGGMNTQAATYPGGVVTLDSTGIISPSPISKLPPVVACNYIIALNGIFPIKP